MPGFLLVRRKGAVFVGGEKKGAIFCFYLFSRSEENRETRLKAILFGTNLVTRSGTSRQKNLNFPTFSFGSLLLPNNCATAAIKMPIPIVVYFTRQFSAGSSTSVCTFQPSIDYIDENRFDCLPFNEKKLNRK